MNASRRLHLIGDMLARAAWLSAAGLAATETGVGLDLILANERPNCSIAGNGERARIGRARRFAIYLAVTHFGLTQTNLARAAGMTRQQVFTALRRTEDDREEAAIDALLDSLALRLPAPPSGCWGSAWAA